jgi:hypothetical protein
MVGCTTPVTMPVADLNNFHVDCSNRYNQLAFLRSQIPSQRDRITNSIQMTTVAGVANSYFDHTFQDQRVVFDDKQSAYALYWIRMIEQNCPADVPKPQNCTYVREQFPAGESQGALCYTRQDLRPIVNRWEALVDKR